ncbi:MAG TPA: hypothetical protein VMT44_03255 [Methanoregula sp.]|nr:hypothetical protein [Methanoregula sp.]
MHNRTIIAGIGLVVLIGLLAAAGCTVPTTPQGTPASGTGTSTGSGAPSGVTGAGNLVTSATDVIPDYQGVTINVGEKDYLGVIPVIFQGGKGQIQVKSIAVTLYRADGQIMTATIGTNKGDEADLQGTKQTDRVVVKVTMINGQTYTTNDVLSPYRTRG